MPWALLRTRFVVIIAAMRYWSKHKWIMKHIKGRNVLDLGCVEHVMTETDVPWLHEMVRRNAASVLGVDFLEQEVQGLREQGYNVVCADVETMELGKKFDVIVAGDIIEHLANPGKFLQQAARHLVPGGLLLVTTPNPFCMLRFWRGLLHGRVGSNPEHTCWFSMKTLRGLAGRFGWEVREEAYVDDSRLYYRVLPRKAFQGHWGKRIRIVFRRLMWQPCVWLNSLLCLVRPQMSETLCVAFGLREKP